MTYTKENRREYQAEWYQENKERTREQRKKKRLENKEKNPRKTIVEKWSFEEDMQIRYNLRNIRMNTPLDSNGGKHLSIRQMAEILGSTSAHLSRLETGCTTQEARPSELATKPKKPLASLISASGTDWVYEYSRILGVPKHCFYPAANNLLSDEIRRDLARRKYRAVFKRNEMLEAALERTLRIVETQTQLLKKQDKSINHINAYLKLALKK